MSTPAIQLRDLTSLLDCRAVVEVQEAVWGRDSETVPATALFVSAKRGGILIGAYVEHVLTGFVWSLRGIREGAPTQWSHMLGVLPAWRGHGIAERLKVAQRERALGAGVDLIEWTFDPLQAANAHFNLQVLGAVGASYGVDVYGALAGPLHRGTPTDRLTAEWWIREPHVERRLARRTGGRTAQTLVARSAEVLEAPDAIQIGTAGDWVRVEGSDSTLSARRVRVSIPPRFLEMQAEATDLALAWRLATREVMSGLFGRGYRAVDFELNRQSGGGSYLFARAEAGADGRLPR